jgi:hypothetical protein
MSLERKAAHDDPPAPSYVHAASAVRSWGRRSASACAGSPSASPGARRSWSGIKDAG